MQLTRFHLKVSVGKLYENAKEFLKVIARLNLIDIIRKTLQFIENLEKHFFSHLTFVVYSTSIVNTEHYGL